MISIPTPLTSIQKTKDATMSQTWCNSIAKNLFKIAALSVIASNAQASQIVNVNTKYYSILGYSANELRAAMTSKSPVIQNGKKYDAYTSWYVKWRFNWNQNGGRCTMSKVDVTVDVEFTLPKWVNRDDADSGLRSEWDSYYKALTNHENGHKEFGINAGKEVENVLMNLSENSCQALEVKANAIGKEIIDKYGALEKQYDQQTNHGMNEGAVFPRGKR